MIKGHSGKYFDLFQIMLLISRLLVFSEKYVSIFAEAVHCGMVIRTFCLLKVEQHELELKILKFCFKE